MRDCYRKVAFCDSGIQYWLSLQYLIYFFGWDTFYDVMTSVCWCVGVHFGLSLSARTEYVQWEVFIRVICLKDFFQYKSNFHLVRHSCPSIWIMFLDVRR